MTLEEAQKEDVTIYQGNCSSCNVVKVSPRWHSILMTNGRWRVVCDTCYNKAIFKEAEDEKMV